MRITLDIPDALHQQLKAKAAREKLPINELILQGVERDLRLQSRKNARRVKLPLIRSRRPGSLDIDNRKIYDLISFP